MKLSKLKMILLGVVLFATMISANASSIGVMQNSAGEDVTIEVNGLYMQGCSYSNLFTMLEDVIYNTGGVDEHSYNYFRSDLYQGSGFVMHNLNIEGMSGMAIVFENLNIVCSN